MPDIASLYADLSGYYDQFCAEIDYAEQAAFAQRVFQCFASSGGYNYLDLACGTGALLAQMQPYGFSQTGLDNSDYMLAQAAIKVPDTELLLTNMADLDRESAFDLVTCFLYSIHYNYPVIALEEALKRVWLALKPGGIFVFNAVDASGVRSNQRIVTRIGEEDAELSFESGWSYSGSGEILALQLSITRKSPNDVDHWNDTHCMTAISFNHLISLLTGLDFELTLLEHDYLTMRPWDGKSYNMIVVAGKPLLAN